MVQARRSSIRRSVLTLVAAAAILSLGLVGMQHRTLPVGAQQAARAAVLQQYFDAVNRGDASGATAVFADNAIFVAAGGTLCTPQAPCTDAAGVLQRLQSNVAGHACQTLDEVQVAGAIVSGRFESRNDAGRARGVGRVLESFIAQVSQDKITFLAVLFDTEDPQTALNLAIGAGTAQPTSPPIPNPATVCGAS